MTQEKIDNAIEGKHQWEKRLLTGLSDSVKFNKIVEALTLKVQHAPDKADKIACFEALGFPLGACVAQGLNAGLVLVRKIKSDEAPNEIASDFETEMFLDFDNNRKIFKVLKSSVPNGTKILIVDDLCETGAQLKAATTLFTRLGAVVIGAVFVGCIRPNVENAGYNFPIHNLTNEETEELLPYNLTF